MDNAEWESVLQYITDPSEFAVQPERPVAEMTGLPIHAQHPPPTQMPTPPCSDESTPPNVEGFTDCNTIVSVSTTFHPGANLLSIPPDVILLSSDGVFFSVHTTQVLSASTNNFNNLVPIKPSKSHIRDDLGPVVPLPESANVLNIILHVVYDLSCAQYHPSIDTLIAAVDTMPSYGLPPKQHISPSNPLYSLILGQAPMQPITVYALAARHDLHELAVPVSSHLLSYALHSLTDELAVRIGPVYMKRLFFLHLGRLEALKRLLLPPPHPHPPTSTCDFIEQKKLTRAWALASAYLAWDARPDLSTSVMEGALCPLADHLSCDICKQSLADRVKQLIVQWSVVKVNMT